MLSEIRDTVRSADERLRQVSNTTAAIQGDVQKIRADTAAISEGTVSILDELRDIKQLIGDGGGGGGDWDWLKTAVTDIGIPIAIGALKDGQRSGGVWDGKVGQTTHFTVKSAPEHSMDVHDRYNSDRLQMIIGNTATSEQHLDIITQINRQILQHVENLSNSPPSGGLPAEAFVDFNFDGSNKKALLCAGAGSYGYDLGHPSQGIRYNLPNFVSDIYIDTQEGEGLNVEWFKLQGYSPIVSSQHASKMVNNERRAVSSTTEYAFRGKSWFVQGRNSS